MAGVTDLLATARRVYEEEGVAPLFLRTAAFAVRWLVRYESFYVFQYDRDAFARLREEDFLPTTDNALPRVLSTSQEADELEAQGFRFYERVPHARRRLDAGARAFCVFVGQELGCVAWLCTTQQAKDSLGEPPVRVDFHNNEAWVGGFWTDPSYRRMRLHSYNIYRILDCPFREGILMERYVVQKRNRAALRAESRAAPTVYAEGRLLKVLWWKRWKERPIGADVEPVQSQYAGEDSTSRPLTIE